jgi:membrane protease subunit (stomatin/prohibitin family)
MGLLNESRREFIAAPDSSKGQIVYKWPDDNIRKFSRAIVEPDAQAVFMSQGKVMGVLPPGQHTLDASELPFLGMFIDWASAGNAFKAELYFVGTREYPNVRFGGRLDDIQDPMSGLIVTMRAFGEYALKVDDPTKLILNLVGTVDVADNDAITGWVGQQLLKVTRTSVTTQLASGAWPILGLSQHSPDIEAATMPAANVQLADYGVSICRFGNLDVNLSEEDSTKLKKLANDYAYSKLAGGFLQAAQAEALQGMGQGMAEGGGSSNPMIVGMGMGMAGQVAAAPSQAPYQAPEAPNFAGAPVGSAGYPVADAAPASTAAAATPPAAAAPTADAAPTAPATVACPSCQAQVREGAKFCDSCGTKMQAQCANCQSELRPGAKFCDSCGTAVA